MKNELIIMNDAINKAKDLDSNGDNISWFEEFWEYTADNGEMLSKYPFELSFDEHIYEHGFKFEDRLKFVNWVESWIEENEIS